MKNKIALKLTLYFSAALFLFAVIIGVLFITIFRDHTIDEHRNDMEERAETIAAALSDYMGASNGAIFGKGSGSGMGGFGVYLRMIDDIAGTSVWLVDENLNLITSGLTTGKDYSYADLPADAEKVVGAVFQGATTFSEGFSSLLNTPTLTVGTPITANGKIIGAVLMHSPVEGIDDSITQGIWILIYSVLAALAIAVLLSVFLALKFTKPLNKMKQSTAQLASGDYRAKTNITQNDEIGELAKSIDTLSVKLEDARRQTEKLDTLRRDFVANISHELRTPVTVLRGSLEALCDEVITDPERVKMYHRQMLSESLTLQRLVNDLLDLSRLQNSDFKIVMDKLNIYDVLTDVVRSASQIASEKNITVKFDSDTQVLPFNGDYDRLRQMFLIVLDNAVKFSPTDSTLSVVMKDSVIKITDHGCGIPPEDLPYVFDRFYKVKSEDNKTGSGLGLAIAKQIADRHGIRLEVSSELYAGTEFIFYIN